MPDEKKIKVKFVRPADGKEVEAEVPVSMLPDVKKMNEVNNTLNSKYNLFNTTASSAGFNELNPVNIQAGLPSGSIQADYQFTVPNMDVVYHTGTYKPTMNPFLYGAGYTDKTSQDDAFKALYNVNSYLSSNGYGDLVTPDYRYGARHIVFGQYEQPTVKLPEEITYDRSGTAITRQAQNYSTGAKIEKVIQNPDGTFSKVFIKNPNAVVTGEKNTFGETTGINSGGYTQGGAAIPVGTQFNEGKTNDPTLLQGDAGIKQDQIFKEQRTYIPVDNSPKLIWDKTQVPAVQNGQYVPPTPMWRSFPFGGFINQGITTAAKAFGADEKTAQIIGSGVATATGLIPGMQDNLMQGADLVGDLANTSENKNIQTAGQIASPLTQVITGSIMANKKQPAVYGKGGPLIPNVTPIAPQQLNPYAFNGIPSVNTGGKYGQEIQTNMNAGQLQNYVKSGQLQEGQYVNPVGQQPQVGIIPNGIKPKFENPADKVAFYQNLKSPAMISLMNQALPQIAKSFAAGGELTTYDTGGTHEQNPLGGVPVGNNLVEQGETRWEDYVFSNRLTIPGSKQTFAQASKQVESKFKDRPNDPFSKKSKDQMMNALMQQQEELKQQMTLKAQKKLVTGGPLDKPLATDENPWGIDIFGNGPSIVSNDMKLPQIKMVTEENPFGSNPNLTPLNIPNTQAGMNAGLTGGAKENNQYQESPYNFNSKLSGAEYAAAFVPAVAGLATGLSGAAKTSFDRVDPSFVDYDPQRQALQRQYNTAYKTANENIRGNASTSGQALSSMIASNVALTNNLNDQMGSSFMNEANMNSQIQNQANNANANISMQETIANEQNKARQQEFLLGALNSAANSYLGLSKDKRAFDANNFFNNQFLKTSASNEFIYDPITGTRYKNPNYK